MAIKLVLLKSGDELICDLTNMEIGEEDDKKVVGYYLSRPCLVDYQPTGEPNEFTIQLKQWMPLSANPLIPLAAGWVVTVLDPAKQLYDVYKEQIMTPKGVQEWMGRAEEGATDHLQENTPDSDGLTPEQYAVKESEETLKRLGERYGHGLGPQLTEDNENGQDNQDSSTDESTDSDN
jgi:hypothetical protein